MVASVGARADWMELDRFTGNAILGSYPFCEYRLEVERIFGTPNSFLYFV